jgi:hypothetical protein
MYFNMPSNNTIDDVCAKSTATKTSSNEKVWVTNVDRVGRQHKTTTMCGTELKNYASDETTYGTKIMCLRHGWLNRGAGYKLSGTRDPEYRCKTKECLCWMHFKVINTGGQICGSCNKQTLWSYMEGWLLNYISVNKPFKGNFNQLYSKWTLAGDHALTPARQQRMCRTAVPEDQDHIDRSLHKW